MLWKCITSFIRIQLNYSIFVIFRSFGENMIRITIWKDFVENVEICKKTFLSVGIEYLYIQFDIII